MPSIASAKEGTSVRLRATDGRPNRNTGRPTLMLVHFSRREYQRVQTQNLAALGGASPFMPTISRRLASAGIADRFGSNPNSLGSASLPTPTSLECQPDERAGPVC